MIGCAIYHMQFGFLKMVYEDEKIIRLDYINHEVITDYGIKTMLTEQVYNQLVEYLAGKRNCFDFPYEMRGTDFQKRVWKALCDIPYGETRSYKDIAKSIGNEKASRAVGMANNKNPMMIVVPCHRVVGANGNLVGYAGGVELKQYLLDIEK